MILAQTAETAKAVMEGVDKAAVAGDRWLFIATLVILLAFAAIVIKFLVRSSEAKDRLHAEERKASDAEIKLEREASRTQRKEDQALFLASIEKLAIDTRAMAEEVHKNTDVLIAHDKDMREAHKIDLRQLVHDEFTRLNLPVTPREPHHSHIGS